MYRKYSNSSKCSRNERLAQLTEQESVIERKKREILAKLEAKKKKETEEALKKLETSSTYKKDVPHTSTKSSWYRKEKDVEEEAVREVPRNAFSNDGSFLDQFKKLSRTGLGPQNMDISTLAKANKRDEEPNRPSMVDKEDEDKIGQSWERREGDQHIHSETSPRGGYGGSNLHHQLSTPGIVPPIVPHQIMPPQMVTVTQPYVPGVAPVPVPPPSLNSVPQFTTNEIQLKAISSPPFSNSITYQPPQQHQFPVTDNMTRDAPHLAPSLSSSSLPSVSAIEPPLPIKPQNIPPPMPMQVQNIPPPPMSPQMHENYETNHNERREKKDSDDSSDSYYSKQMSDEGRKQKTRDAEFGDDYSSPHHNTDAPQLGNISKSRVSPALSDEEEVGSSDSESSRSGRGENRRYPEDAEGMTHARSPKDRSRRRSSEKNQKESAASPRFSSSNVRRSSESDNTSTNRTANTGSVIRNCSMKRRNSCSDNDSSDSDSVSRDSNRSNKKAHKISYEYEKNKSSTSRDGYQADCEDESSFAKASEQRQKKMSFHKSSSDGSSSRTSEDIQDKIRGCERSETVDHSVSGDKPRRKKKSRWGDEVVPSPSNSGPNTGIQLPPTVVPLASTPAGKTPLLSKLTRSDPGLIQYAKQTFGSTNLSEEDWKKAEDHYKINLLYQDMVKKRAEIDSLEKAGKFKYEYDSDEDVEGGTWEHKLRQQEMMATQLWAEELTRQAAGKHHIGDFLPPEELERFMERYNAVKEGRKPDLSDYKEFKLKEDNVGYKLLQKMGWNEGQGLGQDGTGITNPVNKATTRHENQGLGVDRPDGLEAGDDEYDAYRKRMMLAYRFRPNPLNNPRRPYY